MDQLEGLRSEIIRKRGWRDAVKHANENLDDTPIESILVELNAKPAAAKHAAKKPGS